MKFSLHLHLIRDQEGFRVAIMFLKIYIVYYTAWTVDDAHDSKRALCFPFPNLNFSPRFPHVPIQRAAAGIYKLLHRLAAITPLITAISIRRCVEVAPRAKTSSTVGHFNTGNLPLERSTMCQLTQFHIQQAVAVAVAVPRCVENPYNFILVGVYNNGWTELPARLAQYDGSLESMLLRVVSDVFCSLYVREREKLKVSKK